MTPPPPTSRHPVQTGMRVQNLDVAKVSMRYPLTQVERDLQIFEASAPIDIEDAVSHSAGAEKTGQGVYGSVYTMDLRWNGDRKAARGLNLLRELRDLVSNAVYGSDLSPKHTVAVVKIGRPQKNEPWSVFVKRNVRENAAHIAVQKANRNIVPTLFYAGSVRGAYVSVMAHAGGNSKKATTLHDFVKKVGGGRIPRKVFDNIRKAVTTCLKIGIVHADLHSGNVMVLPDLSVKLIDFGFAVQLTPEQTRLMRRLVDRNTDRAWNAIKTYVNAVQLQRMPGLTWYNPEVQALRYWSRFTS